MIMFPQKPIDRLLGPLELFGVIIPLTQPSRNPTNQTSQPTRVFPLEGFQKTFVDSTANFGGISSSISRSLTTLTLPMNMNQTVVTVGTLLRQLVTYFGASREPQSRFLEGPTIIEIDKTITTPMSDTGVNKWMTQNPSHGGALE